MNRSSGDRVNVAGRLHGGDDIDVSPLGGEQTGCLSCLAHRGKDGKSDDQTDGDNNRGEEGKGGATCAAAIAFLQAALSSEDGESIVMVLVVNCVGGRFLRDLLVFFVR